jgi:hypothetical protein
MPLNSICRATLDRAVEVAGIDRGWVENDDFGAIWWPSVLPIYFLASGPHVVGPEGFVEIRVQSPLVAGFTLSEAERALALNGFNEQAALGACVLNSQADAPMLMQIASVAVPIDHSERSVDSSLRAVAAAALTSAVASVPLASHFQELAGGTYVTGRQHATGGVRRDMEDQVQNFMSSDRVADATAFVAPAIVGYAQTMGWNATHVNPHEVRAQLVPGVAALPDRAVVGSRRFAFEAATQLTIGLETDDDWGACLTTRIDIPIDAHFGERALMAWALNSRRLEAAPTSVAGAWHAPSGSQTMLRYVSRWPGELVDEKRAVIRTSDALYEAAYAAAWLADQGTIAEPAA